MPGEFFFEGYEILYFWEAQQWFISRRGKLFRNISLNRAVDSFMQNLTFDMTELLKSSNVFKILLTFHPLASYSFLSRANALTQYWTNTIQHPAMVGKCLSGLPFTAKLANYFIYTHVRYEFNLDNILYMNNVFEKDSSLCLNCIVQCGRNMYKREVKDDAWVSDEN